MSGDNVVEFKAKAAKNFLECPACDSIHFVQTIALIQVEDDGSLDDSLSVQGMQCAECGSILAVE